MKWLCIGVLLGWAGMAWGQVACTPERTWTFDPGERDNVGFQFVGRTLSAATLATATLMRRTVADATPSAIVTAAGVSGDLFTLTVYPDQGCGTPGCRAGNTYQITVQPTDSNSLTPMGHACLVVRKTILRQP